MGLKSVVTENLAKSIFAVILTPALAWGLTWLNTNIVFAGDLDSLADKISADLGKQLQPLKDKIEPLARQTVENSRAICVARKADLKSTIRDLKVEIDEMEKDKAKSPGMWTVRDQRLLDEWMEDYEAASNEFAALDCP